MTLRRLPRQSSRRLEPVEVGHQELWLKGVETNPALVVGFLASANHSARRRTPTTGYF